MNVIPELKVLSDLNEELENYFRNTIIPQLFVDANFILRKFTPPAMKQFNFTPADIGKPFTEMLDNIRFPSILSNIKHVINTSQVLEKEIQTTDLRWYQMNILPYIVQKTNETNGVIITFVDITPRIKDLKEQEKLIADHEILLDTISHDIKNPLTNLGLAVELFKSAPLANAAEFEPVLVTIERAVLRMKDIITELTDTRRKEHRYKAEEELLHFEHILEDVRLSMADDIYRSKAKIFSEINLSELTYSRRKLRSILYNLISNAIKYRSPHRTPEIYIKTAKENNCVLLCVEDNGMGIDEANLDKVFSKYYRVSDAIEGSGVGLFLIKEIVVNTGGKISVKSEPGKGSEFQVCLKIS